MGGIGGRAGGIDGDRGHGDVGLTGVGEPESLEENHGTRIGGNFQGFDLGGHGRKDHNEGEDEEEEG